MTTIEDDGDLRISLLLLKGWRMVFEGILNREVQKSGKSIDESLNTFELQLIHPSFERQFQVLFPASGATNIKDWDIQTYTEVLLKVFKKGLDEEEKEAILTINVVYEETSHPPLRPLTHSEYEDLRKKLVAGLEFLSSKLDNPIPSKCKELIKECSESRLDAATIQQLLKGIRGTEEQTNEILGRLDQILNEPKQIDDEHEKTRKESVENRNIVVDEIRKILKDKERSKQTICIVLDYKLTLKGHKGQHELIEAAEKIIECGINAAVDKAGSTEYSLVMPALNDVIRTINCIPGVEVQHAKPTCMLIQFVCKSYEGLLNLFLYIASEAFKQSLSKIVEAVCAVLPLNKPIYLSPELSPESLKEILNSINVHTENEKSNNARQDAERPASDSEVKTSFGKNETDEDKSGNNRSYKIDTQAWQRCIDSKNIQEADRLVNEGILPDQDLLDRAADQFGMSSRTVKNICDSICLYMKENTKQIAIVYPATDCRHESTRNHITFIIFTAQPSGIDVNEYRIDLNCLHVTPSSLPDDENMIIKRLEEDCQKDWSEAEKIGEIINKYSTTLMENHTNITRISISWIKSKGYGKENHSTETKTCIAVNVRAKGLVPVNEEVLPKTIDGIDVDVREGVAFSCGGPNEPHEYLKMGCAVHGGLKDDTGKITGGTLGGFVEINDELFCISCAHNFLSSDDMMTLENSRGRPFGNEIKTFDVYQPISEAAQAFGEGIRAVYEKGGRGKTGVDAVLIKVKNRLPISGEFPECPHKRNAELKHQTFSSGRMLTRDEVLRLMESNNRTVVKFGSTTGWTKGTLRFGNSSARLSQLDAAYNNTNIELHNQFEVESTGKTLFADYGDSGALVFKDENDQLSAIGIVEGYMEDKVLVTPIFEVFAALGLEAVRNMKKLENNLQNMGKNFEALVHQTIAKHTAELRQNIRMSLNQEMSQGILELKNKIDTSNAEVKTLIQNQNEMITNIVATSKYQIQSPMTTNADNSLSQTSQPRSSISNHTHVQTQNQI